MPDPRRSPTERVVLAGVEHELGAPLSERVRHTQRSLESYLNAGVRPRWMERLMEIDRWMARTRRELAPVHRALHAEHAGDPATFARRWREWAAGVSFDEVNALIRSHNQWYPVERDLPIDPRTGEYRVKFRRAELGPDWVLEQFPAA